MKSRVIILFIAIITTVSTAFGQVISFSDSSITYKNAEGRILSNDEVREIIKQNFSIRQELVKGKKIVTVLSAAENEIAKRNAKLETFRKSLLSKPLAAFNLTDINNNIWNSEKLKGKVLLLNFWFTTCGPCIREMPHLNELVKQNKNSPVIFMAPAPENESQVNKFLKKFNFEYNIIPSSAEYISKLTIENFPTHIVVDKKGIIRQVIIGYADDIKEKLQAEIDKLVK